MNTLELNPFEVGLLMGVLIKYMSECPNDKPIIEPIYNKLKDIAIEIESSS